MNIVERDGDPDHADRGNMGERRCVIDQNRVIVAVGNQEAAVSDLDRACQRVAEKRAGADRCGVGVGLRPGRAGGDGH
jgi:hypothetical protein